jgi:outer membrane protein assembly factor BamB
VQGIDPDDGEVLWRYDWPTYVGINVAQPIVVGADRVFVSSGYGMGCATLKISETDGALAVEELWSSRHMRNKFSSSVVYDGNVYGLNEAILGCIGAESGERRWKGGRYNYGSLMLARGHLIVLSEDGELILVEATPDGHNEKGRVRIFDAGKNWNNFAIVGGRLFARNHKEMVCYDLRPASTTAN